MQVLVTGARGFIGQALVERLDGAGNVGVIGAVRSAVASAEGATRFVAVGDIDARTDWSDALRDVDVVVHLAARAHVLNDKLADPLSEFRRVNVEGALALFKQAIEHKVKRFIFISSIGVNGNLTKGEPFSEGSIPAPHAAYAQSKFEAEEALKALAETAGVELVIIRPPLVYAAHAPGNFARLLKLVDLAIPLPFGSVHNRRSMVALENLVDFIACCVRHPAAAGQTFLVSDCEDVSLRQMLQLLAKGMGQRSVLLPIPPPLIGLAATVLGKKSLFNQLCGSLQVSSTKSREVLGWVPPLSVEQALIETGKAYKHSVSGSRVRKA